MKVTIKGKEYPARITMGAMLRFRRETGHDVSDMKYDDLADLITFIWCCVASECNAEKVEFGYSLMDFADMLDTSLITTFSNEIKKEAGASEPDANPPTS